MDEEQIDITTQKTVLEWDNYINYLIEAIDESNFMKRAECKPMQTTKHDLESHVTSRAAHVRAAADIAKRIAEGLGLNYKYIYAGMLMHDAGHPFSAHEGEEIFSGIGQDYNVDYYHHNAKGVEVVIAENICEKALNKIPNIKNRPELRKKLEDEFYYFLDIIISHDGEAGVQELGAEPEEYADIKTAVYEKLRLANSTNKYKFVAQTIEGRIAKYADVIAYLSTDIQDRFRLGIQKGFDDDYLEFIGEILSDDFVTTREEKIEIARSIIDEIKEEKLMQLLRDAKAIENQEVIQYANEIIDRIRETTENYEEQPVDLQEKIAEEVMEEYIEEYKNKHDKENMTEEEKKFLYADIEKIREFTRKKLRMRTSVVETITSRIRETLINDFLKESKLQNGLTFSKGMKKLFFRAKELNYRYVPETKWDYQRKHLPVAVHKLVHMIARDLRKSGAIQNKFYDRAMRKHIKSEEALRYLKTLGFVEDKEFVDYRRKNGIRTVRHDTGKKFTSEGGRRDKNIARGELANSAYHYVLDSGELFAQAYENTFYSVENQIISKIKHAIGKLSPEESKKRETHIEFFDTKIAEQEAEYRKKLIARYGSVENITEEEIARFARPIIERERKRMEGKMAVQMAINYISGMTDKALSTHGIEIGVLDESVIESGTRGSSEEEKVIFVNRFDTKVEDEPTK